MRSPSIALAVAFGCSACLLVVDTTGLTGGVVDPNVTDGALPAEAGGDGGDDAGTDADATVTVGTYRDLVMADSPLVYLRLGETTGNVAFDETGQHNGTIDSRVVKDQDSLVKGDSNRAMVFVDGSFISVPAFDGMLAGKKAFSIEAWILVSTAISTPMWIVGREDVTSPRYGNSFIVANSSTNGPELALEQWQAGSASRATAPMFVAGKPTHVVATYDGTVLTAYMNAKSSPVATVVTGTVMDVAATSISIGSQSSHLGGFFHGTIDEVAIYDHVLPAASITAHYERGKP